MSLVDMTVAQPDGWESSILNGLWATAWLFGISWVAYRVFLNWWHGWPAGDEEIPEEDDDKDRWNPW